jgi:hypothetical protein
VLFEDTHAGMTPFSYFVDHAPLSAEEKRLYQACRDRTRYESLVVEKSRPVKNYSSPILPAQRASSPLR